MPLVKKAVLATAQSFVRDRRGSIAPMFAVASTVLILAAGASVDLARVVGARGQMQDLADAAALAGASNFTAVSSTAATSALTAAENFVTAQAATLPGHPTVSVSGSISASCNLGAQAASAGALVAQVCVLQPVSPNYLGTVQVAITYNMKTMLAASVAPSVPTTVRATAQGGVSRIVTVTLNHFSSSASDLDQVYYYTVPQDSSGAMLTGQALYAYTPDLTKATLLLSDAATFTNPSSISLQIPYGSRPAFALTNTTGGVKGYGSNCYNMSQGSSKTYYSTREAIPTSTTTAYYDFGATAFHSCGGGNDGDTSTTLSSVTYTQLSPCTVQTSTYYGYTYYTTSCRNSYSYSAGNYVYPWGYSRNPLQYGLLNRNSSGMPTGGTTNNSVNTDCTTGDVTYNWDDNGGASSDDNDFNDMVYTVNCQSTGSLNSSVRLVN